MFEPTDTLAIGFIIIQFEIISYFVGLVFVLMCFSYAGRKYSLQWMKSFIDTVISSIIIGLLAYKFWPFVEQPQSFLEKPYKLLLYSGGAYSKEAFIIVAILWFLYKGWHSKWFEWLVIEWGLMGFLLYRIIVSFMLKEYGTSTTIWGWTIEGITYFPLNVYEFVSFIIVLAAFFLMRMKCTVPTKDRVGMLLIALNTTLIVKSFFAIPSANSLVWGNTLVDVIVMLGLVTGVLLLLGKSRITER